MAIRLPIYATPILDEQNADIILDEAGGYVFDETTAAGRTVIGTSRTVIGSTRGAVTSRTVI